MKTMNKILLMSAVALSMTAVSNAKADGALLSPRAQENQIRTVAGTNSDPDLAHRQMAQNGVLLSPRAQANQATRVAGTNSDPDLVAAMQAQTGSPKSKSLQPVQVYQIAPMK
jgi:hypothetical protein